MAINKILRSPMLMLALIVIYCISMGLATFVEKFYGINTASIYVYHNVWFIVLQVLMIVNGLAIMRHRGVFSRKKIGTLILHSSFIIILLGALITHIFGREGYMHIREGQSSNVYIDSRTNESMKLDFVITLDDFVLTRYPGSSAPASYESHISINVNKQVRSDVVRMNKTVNVGGYRFFQTSFDKDEQGTLLTVNYDVPGMYLTYLGYVLLLLGMIFVFFQTNSRFKVLYKKLSVLGCVILFVFFSYGVKAQNSVAKEQAEEFGRLLMQNNKGRLEPVNTWSSKILRKIYGDTEYKDFSSDQIFLNMFLLSNEWANEDIIIVKNKDIQAILECGKYTYYNNFFNDKGEYKLQELLNCAYDTPPAERNKMYKDLIGLDEVISIIYQIQGGGMMPIFPHPTMPNAKWLSPLDSLNDITGQDSLFLSKITIWYVDEVYNGMSTGDYSGASKVLDMIHTYQNAKSDKNIDMAHIEKELLYNRLNIFGQIFKFYLIFGGLLLVLQFLIIFHMKARLMRCLSFVLLSGMGLVFLYQTYGIGLRWYISGHGPWSNSYETMIFVSWTCVFIGFVFVKKIPLITALSSLLTGVLLFVASLNWMNPEISPLVPVLQSYWLMVHVAVIMLGYGFFFINAFIGMTNLIIYSFLNIENNDKLLLNIQKMTIINEMAMIIGVYLMGAGIFLGAVWANVSWGRYWGWDPKETWALITMMTYVGILHMRFIPRLNNMWLFNIKSMWAILVVLMTYFGVNYYLSGMHSYGNSGGSLFSLPVFVGLVVFVVVTICSYLNFRRCRKTS